VVNKPEKIFKPVSSSYLLSCRLIICFRGILTVSKKGDENGQKQDSSGQDSLWHHRLAIIIFSSSFFLVALVIFGIFWVSSDKDKASQLVVTSVLPVIGAWVGAVIAFYFSSKNLESATNSVKSLVSSVSSTDKLSSIWTKDKMITRGEMFVEHTSDDKITLYAILSDLQKANKGERIPVLDNQNLPRCVIHRSVIDKYITQKALEGNAKATLSNLTLEQLIADRPELKHLFGLVAEDSTLADAKKVMDGIVGCQDLFVTKSGSEKEEVTGWVTNVIIEDNSKVA